MLTSIRVTKLRMRHVDFSGNGLGNGCLEAFKSLTETGQTKELEWLLLDGVDMHHDLLLEALAMFDQMASVGQLPKLLKIRLSCFLGMRGEEHYAKQACKAIIDKAKTNQAPRP